MTTERFGGVPIKMDQLTDEETMTVLDNALERMYRAEQEVLKAMGYAAIRGLIPGAEIHEVSN